MQPQIKRIANQSMPDTDFIQPWYALMQIRQIMQVQIMTGIQTKAASPSLLCRYHKRRHSKLAIRSIAGRIRSRIEFHTISPARCSTFNHSGIRIHKHRCSDSGFAQLAYDTSQEILMAYRIPSVIGCQLCWRIWHQCHLRRTHPQYKPHKAVIRVSFDIEFCAEDIFQRQHISVSDMALVRPWVYGYALGSENFAVQCHLLHVGIILTARITQCGNFVDIYT